MGELSIVLGHHMREASTGRRQSSRQGWAVGRATFGHRRTHQQLSGAGKAPGAGEKLTPICWLSRSRLAPMAKWAETNTPRSCISCAKQSSLRMVMMGFPLRSLIETVRRAGPTTTQEQGLLREGRGLAAPSFTAGPSGGRTWDGHQGCGGGWRISFSKCREGFINKK